MTKQPLKNNRFQHNLPGVSLTEYSLVFGLVAIVGIGGLTVLGETIRDDFANMITRKPPAPIATPTIAPTPTVPVSATPTPSPAVIPSPPSVVVSTAGIGGVVPSPANGQQKVCFGSGLCANVTVVNDQTHPDVSGGNGGQLTHQFANTLSQIAQQVAKEGSDPGLADLISQLANQGHGIGGLQDSMSGQCKPNSAAGKCTIQMAYTGDQTDPNSSQLNTLKSDFQTKLSAVMNQLQGFQQPLKDDIAIIIQSQSNQIMTLANGYQATVNIAPKGGSKMVTNSNNAQLIHQSANTICDQGGHNCHQAG